MPKVQITEETILNLEAEILKLQKKVNQLESKITIADSLIRQVYGSLGQYLDHIQTALEAYLCKNPHKKEKI